MIKLSKAGGIGCPFQLNIFFNKAFLIFDRCFLHLGVLGLE